MSTASTNFSLSYKPFLGLVGCVDCETVELALFVHHLGCIYTRAALVPGQEILKPVLVESGEANKLSLDGLLVEFAIQWGRILNIEASAFPCRTVFYGQYKCFGPGANEANRPAWSHELSDAQAAPFMTLGYIDGSLWVTGQ